MGVLGQHSITLKKLRRRLPVLVSIFNSNIRSYSRFVFLQSCPTQKWQNRWLRFPIYHREACAGCRYGKKSCITSAVLIEYVIPPLYSRSETTKKGIGAFFVIIRFFRFSFSCWHSMRVVEAQNKHRTLKSRTAYDRWSQWSIYSMWISTTVELLR